MTKFGIVTPSFNQSAYIASTICSVMSQSGDFEVDYVIQDGGSTDNTLQLIKPLLAQSSSLMSITVNTGHDNGQYDAINKGFERLDCDIMAWINSDDIYMPWAFSVVAEVFARFPDIDWIIGAPLLFNTTGQCVNVPIIKVFPSALIRKGLHIHHGDLYSRGWIGQDSVFWRSSLWAKAGAQLNIEWDLAADYDLWLRFSEHAELVSVASPLAGFRIQPSQKSGDVASYAAEARAVHAARGLTLVKEGESLLRKALGSLSINGNAAVADIAERLGLLEKGDNISYDLTAKQWIRSRLSAI